MVKCAIEGCGNDRKIRDYCQMCYNRLWKMGVLPSKNEKVKEVPPLSEPLWQRRSEEVRKKKTAVSVRLSYGSYLRNYKLCCSLSQRMHWRSKMKACLLEAQSLGLSEEDLRLTPEEEAELLSEARNE